MSATLIDNLLALGSGIKIASGERLLLLILCIRANEDGETSLKKADLSRLSGMSYRATRTAISMLEKKGLVAEQNRTLLVDPQMGRNILNGKKLPEEETSQMGRNIPNGKKLPDTFHPKEEETSHIGGTIGGNNITSNSNNRVSKDAGARAASGYQPQQPRGFMKQYAELKAQRLAAQGFVTTGDPDAVGDGRGAVTHPNYTDEQRRFLDNYGKKPNDIAMFRAKFEQAVAETNDAEMLIAAAAVCVEHVREMDGDTRKLRRPENWLLDCGWRDYTREAKLRKERPSNGQIEASPSLLSGVQVTRDTMEDEEEDEL